MLERERREEAGEVERREREILRRRREAEEDYRYWRPSVGYSYGGYGRESKLVISYGRELRAVVGERFVRPVVEHPGRPHIIDRDRPMYQERWAEGQYLPAAPIQPRRYESPAGW
jgi:hypothetical protein